MRKIVTLILILSAILNSSVFAQGKHTKDYKVQNKKADILFDFDDFKSALPLYLNCYAIDSLNEKVNLNIGICYYHLHTLPQTIIKYLEKADRSKDPEVQYYEALVLHQLHKFDEEINHLKIYLSYPAAKREIKDIEIGRMIEIAERAKEFLSSPHKAIIKNIGNVVNTKYDDYVPLVNADESLLYFTSRREGCKGEKDPNGDYYEDIFTSEKVDGQWTAPKCIKGSINTDSHDACVSLSADGQSMIIYRTNKKDPTSGDLYMIKYNGTEWGEPEILGAQINTPYREQSACISLDNTALYFSSDKPGGLGGKDIYRVVKLPNGKWSLPTNLGPGINTPFDEDSPFMHSDGKTLYFSSKGHKGMGMYDIYKTTYDEETKQFSEVENLGYPINTVGNDIFFVQTTDGRHGYYSSLNENESEVGYESEDIYFIDMRYSENDLKVIPAYVSDNTGNAVQAHVTVYEAGSDKVVGLYNSNGATGKFIFVANPFTEYKIVVEAKNYQPEVINYKKLAEDKNDIVADIKITLKKG